MMTRSKVVDVVGFVLGEVDAEHGEDCNKYYQAVTFHY